jgi:hypothetical protein
MSVQKVIRAALASAQSRILSEDETSGSYAEPVRP